MKIKNLDHELYNLSFVVRNLILTFALFCTFSGSFSDHAAWSQEPDTKPDAKGNPHTAPVETTKKTEMPKAKPEVQHGEAQAKATNAAKDASETEPATKAKPAEPVNANSPRNLFRQAQQLHKTGEHAEAAKRYGDVIQVQPNYAPAILGKAECMEAIGELEIALQLATHAANAAAKSNGGNGAARSLQAKILIQKGAYSDAVDVMQSAIARNPADANFLLFRSIALRHLAEGASYDRSDLLERALKSLNRASAITEKSKCKDLQQEVLFEKGMVNAALGRTDEAYEDIVASLAGSGVPEGLVDRIAHNLTRERVRFSKRDGVATKTSPNQPN